MKRTVLIALTLMFWIVETHCLATPQDVTPQNVEATGKVETTDIQVGKPFTLDLSLKVPYGWFVEWNDFNTDTLSEQIDILKRGDVIRTADADSNVIVQQQLTLMTFDTGQVVVPPVGLKYARSFDAPERLTAFTRPIDLNVATMTVDTTLAYKPIVGPMDAPIQMKDVFPWILVFLIAALIGFGIWYLLEHRKAKYDAEGNPIRVPSIPPYDKAVSDLEQLRQQKLWQSGKVKEHFSSLTDIAREYIEGQFGVNAVEMTTDDILEEVRSLRFPKETYDKLKNTMEVADLVKFAKYSASPLESDTAMNDMTDFVEESYTHYQKRKEEEAARQAQMKNAKQDETVGKEAQDV